MNLGLTRTYGRAAPGQRVVEGTPGISGAHYTAIAALGWQGVQAPWIWEGSMTASIFEDYVEYQLAPVLRQGDLVVVDNLSAHKCLRAQQLIEAHGARLVFLPPYSADFNPIELPKVVQGQARVAGCESPYLGCLGGCAGACFAFGQPNGCSSLVRPLWLCLVVNHLGIRSNLVQTRFPA